MLDAFIIDEIKRREQQREDDRRPQAELPLPPEKPQNPPRQSDDEHEKPDRGVVIIDYSVALRSP